MGLDAGMWGVTSGEGARWGQLLFVERDASRCKNMHCTPFQLFAFLNETKNPLQTFFFLFHFLMKNMCLCRPLVEVKRHKMNFGKAGDTCNCSWGCFSPFQSHPLTFSFSLEIGALGDSSEPSV